MHRGILYGVGIVSTMAVVVGLLFVGGQPASVQEAMSPTPYSVANAEVSYFEKGAQLTFAAPRFDRTPIAYDVRYSAAPLDAPAFMEQWEELPGTDGVDTLVVEAGYRTGSVEKVLVFPSTPGTYHVGVRVADEEGLGPMLLMEEVAIPQMEYHTARNTLPRRGIISGLEEVTLEEEQGRKYLTFTAPYGSIISYDVRYAKEELGRRELMAFWNTAYCRGEEQCVSFDQVRMEEGHRERIELVDLPNEGDVYTYGVTFILRTGEVSGVSVPVVVQGVPRPKVGIDVLELVEGDRLYEALRQVGVTYLRGGQPVLSWLSPREAVEYYVVRYYAGELTLSELDSRWNSLPCYAPDNCVVRPNSKEGMEEVALERVPEGAEVYTYGVRYKLPGQDGLSKVSEPVYVIRKQVQVLETLRAMQRDAGVILDMELSSALPPIENIRMEDGGDSFYLVFRKPAGSVLSYQVHYATGGHSTTSLRTAPMECDFIQHPTVRSSDSCSRFYTVIKDGSGSDGEVRLQFRKLPFNGVHTFVIHYYDDGYRKSPMSNPVVVRNDVVPYMATDVVARSIAQLRLFPEEEAVVYRALQEGLLDESLTGFHPHAPINRAMFARYLLLSRGGKVDMLKLSYASVFCDVARDAWYAPYVFLLYQLGVVQGYQEDSCVTKRHFGPDSTVTRGEALKMIFGFYHVVPSTTVDASLLPADVAADGWYAPVMAYSVREGILRSVGGANVYPTQPVTYLETLQYILATRDLVERALGSR